MKNKIALIIKGRVGFLGLSSVNRFAFEAQND